MSDNTLSVESFSDAGRVVTSISVFFPCYNEADNVERTTKNAIRVLERINSDFEVIIVDDGSKDGTVEISDRLAQNDSRIRVIHHPTNLGYGAALQSGYRAAKKKLVFYTDGDGQFDMNELPPLIPLMRQYDFVTCYRLNRQDNLIRKINGWCWTKLVCFLFDMKIKDIDCAFKLFKREIFDNIEMYSAGALIDTEVLARAVRKGYSFTQRGVHHYPRLVGKQTGANLKVIFRAFKELFKLRSQILKDDPQCSR